jgi:hypothetical protein
MLDVIKAWLAKADVVHVRPNALRVLSSPTYIGGGVVVVWIAIGIHDDPVSRYFLMLVGAIPFLTTACAYFFWAFRDPDRLQSEEFILRKQELAIVVHDRPGQTKSLEESKGHLLNVPETEPARTSEQRSVS